MTFKMFADQFCFKMVAKQFFYTKKLDLEVQILCTKYYFPKSVRVRIVPSRTVYSRKSFKIRQFHYCRKHMNSIQFIKTVQFKAHKKLQIANA